MAEKTGDVAQTVRFVTMNGRVVLLKRVFETLVPDTIQLAKTLADKPIESRVGPFLRTTLDDHLHKFNLEQNVRHGHSVEA